MAQRAQGSPAAVPGQLLLSNCRVLDPVQGIVSVSSSDVVVVGERISRITSHQRGEATLAAAQAIGDVIDCRQAPAVMTGRQRAAPRAALQVLEGMLARGVTTVRDCGGADWGLAQAVEEGAVAGPRLLFAGHALSQTGGHGDMRGRRGGTACMASGIVAWVAPSPEGKAGARASPAGARCPAHGCRGEDCCACGSALRGIGRVCDGVPEVRKAARDELRKGAHCIKVMASGGVSSPTDRLENTQFALDELKAAVEEAAACGTYVAAHAYTAPAIKRAVLAGVRSIEHGNGLDEEGAELMATHDAFLVPTLVTYQQLVERGEAAGMRRELVAKAGGLVQQGLEALALAQDKGVTICYGSDLLGGLHAFQLHELLIRAQVHKGFLADLILLDGNPLEDIRVLADPSKLRLVVKGGRPPIGGQLPTTPPPPPAQQPAAMPSREPYEQNEGQAQVGTAGLLSLISLSKNATSGFAGFAVKTAIVSSSAATVFGLCSYMLLHGPLGPGISFLGGYLFGAVGGVVSRWRTDVADALLTVDRFPRLIEHHLRAGEARFELEGQSFEAWRADLRRNPRKQGHVVAAMYSASPTLCRIHSEREEAVAQMYVEDEAAACE
eukprot:scaffold1.g5229.t1